MSSSIAPTSWLLRLFKSDFFNSWIAVQYLFKYPDSIGIQHYLCSELKRFPVSEVEGYLPQLCHLLVSRPDMTALENLLVELCEISTHFAVQTLWYIQSYLSDLQSTPKSPSFRVCKRVMNIVQGIVFNRSSPDQNMTHDSKIILGEGNSYPAIIGIGSVLGAIGSPFAAKLAGDMAITYGKTTKVVNSKDTHALDHENGEISERSPYSLSASSSHNSMPAQMSNSNPSTPASVSPVPSPKSPRSRSQQLQFKLPTTSPSLEDLHRGRAFSFQSFVSKSLGSSISISRPGSRLPSASSSLSPGTSPNCSHPITSGEHMGPNGEANFTDGHYYHSEMQFVLALIAISERLVTVQKEARQSTLTAELTLLNHNFPAAVCIPLWCPATSERPYHHQIVRISPSDAVVLNSADRVPFLIFIEVLENESGFKLLKSASRNELEKTYTGLSTAEGSLLAVLPQPTLTEPTTADDRNTKDNETIASVLSSSSSLIHPTPPPPQTPSTAQERRKPSLSLFTNITSNSNSSTTPPSALSPPISQSTLPIPSPMSPVPETSLDQEFADQMKTAAIMLAQLAIQERQQLVAAGQGAGQITTKKAKAQQLHRTEEIRSRILREMAALEERRLRSLSERANMGESDQNTEKKPLDGLQPDPSEVAATDTAAESQPHSSITESTVAEKTIHRDAEDPSGAVFRETWSKKLSRIRAASPYGSNPNWRLLSVVVKSGADLRQEQLACQLIREMGRLWEEAEVPCWVYPYRVLVTGNDSGLIETVRNSISIHSLKREAYSRAEAEGKTDYVFTLKDYFLQEFGLETSEKFKTAQRNFMNSVAAYSIISYILNVKDRHNGNILLDYTTGHLIHIDYGFMLSNSPGNVSFELAPFKFSQEYVDVLGGADGELFKEFKMLLVRGFLALRKSHERVVGLVEMMEKNSPLPCFSYTSLQGSPDTTTKSKSSATEYPVSLALKERFLLSYTDSQVQEFVEKLIASSMGNIFSRLYDSFQYYSNGIY